MSKVAATPTGAAEGKEPSAPATEGRFILRPSRMEAIESIGRVRNRQFNEEQKEAGSKEFVPENGREMRSQGAEDDDVDKDDVEAEAERARLERESSETDRQERATREKADRDAKAAKGEVERQLAEDERVTVIDDPSKYKVRMKVDGEEQLVDLATVTRTAQKEAAADRRLEQAAQMMKAAEAREAAAKQALAEAGDASKAKAERDLKEAQEAKSQAKAALSTKLKKHAELLYDGKTEEATQLLSEILEPVFERGEAATPKAPEVDEDAIAQRVLAKVKPAVKQELKTESALETFATGYPEIVANPHLAAIADDHFAEARKSGKSEDEALKIAGDKTRAYVRDVAKTLGMSEGRTTTTGRESLEKRKETIDEPQAASTGVSLKDTAPESSNVRSVIAEMASSRPGAAAAAAAARRNEGG